MEITKELLAPKNNYCVYFHKKKTTGEVFYIGSGVQNKREINFTGRSDSWFAVKNEHGVEVETYAKDLSKSEARKIENAIIESGLYSNLVNIRKVAKTDNGLSAELFKDYLYIDSTSPTGIRWKVKTGPRNSANSVAGSFSFSKDGIPKGGTLKLNTKNYSLSRVIWVLYHGFLEDDMVIDHINNNSHDNRIENLRCVTSAENSRNRVRNINSTNENVGVYFKSKDKNASSRFCAVVSINNKRFNKSFSTEKYGFEQAKQMAISWRVDTLRKANEFGANYSDNHVPEIENLVDYNHTVDSYSGIPGLWAKFKDGKLYCISASVKCNGIKRLFNFAIGKYTEEEALRLAKDILSKKEYTEEDLKFRHCVGVISYDSQTKEFIRAYETIREAAKDHMISRDALYKRFEVSNETKVKDKSLREVILTRTK